MPSLKLWDQLREWKTSCTWVELSREMSPETPHWVGFHPMKAETFMDLDTSIFRVHSFTFVSQYGTHVDVARHMLDSGRFLEAIGPDEMVMPLCVIDKTAEVAADPDFVMSVADIEAWEKRYGKIPEGAFVAFQSGWSKRAKETLDNLDADGNRHFPGWGLECLKFLVEERNINAVGHETSDTEAPVTSGQTNYAVEYYLLSKDKFQVELLINVDQCPPVGALIFCSWPRVVGGTGFPARCFALCPK